MPVLFLLHHIGISLESSKRHKLSRAILVRLCGVGAVLFNVSFDGGKNACAVFFFLRAIHAEEFLF